MQVSSIPLLKILQWGPVFFSMKSSPLVWPKDPQDPIPAGFSLLMFPYLLFTTVTDIISSHMSFPLLGTLTSLSQKASLSYHIPISCPSQLQAVSVLLRLTPLEQVVHYITIICLSLRLPEQSRKFWKAKTRSLISVSLVNTGPCKCLWNKQILPFCFIYTYEHVL